MMVETISDLPLEYLVIVHDSGAHKRRHRTDFRRLATRGLRDASVRHNRIR